MSSPFYRAEKTEIIGKSKRDEILSLLKGGLKLNLEFKGYWKNCRKNVEISGAAKVQSVAS
jgi:hypothetical protein